MMPKGAKPTYAQYGEDVVLRALLQDVKQGFYVDIGANDPDVDSVTKSFYLSGWTGINVEPIKELYTRLVKKRPRDVNLQLGVSEQNGQATFREYVNKPGHSTFQGARKEEVVNEEYVDYTVDTKTLRQILTEQKVKSIHFLKIDVEGHELNVLKGMDWKKWRPEVICIEANHSSNDIMDLIQAHQYKLFIFDGLNQYYVANESWHRTKDFAERAALLDYNTMKSHHYDALKHDLSFYKKAIGKMEEQMNNQAKLIASLDAENQKLTQSSMFGKSYPRRIVIAIKGLTKRY